MSVDIFGSVLSRRELDLFGRLVSGSLFSAGAEKKRETLPPVPYPHGQELAYAQALLAISRATSKEVRERLIPRLKRLSELAEVDLAEPERVDAKDAADQLAEIIRDIEKHAGVTAEEARKVALTMLGDVSNRHAAEFGQSIASKLAVNPLLGREKWLRQAMKLAVQENVGLIQSIPEEQLRRVEKIVNDGMVNGQRVEEIADLIYERFDVSDSRSMLIARDQMGKWHGSLTKNRQLDAGIDSYEWSSSLDERVRSSHKELEGKIFKWNDPPVVSKDGRRAHPGGDYQCLPGSTRVESLAGAMHAFRRWHSGQLTTLITSTGETLHLTANHPVLTQRGWVAAELVNEGDKLFRAPIEGLSILHPDLDHMQPSAAQAFDALWLIGSRDRARMQAVDFHGDGLADQEIDVVTIDWGLWPDAQTSELQRPCKLFLESADACLTGSVTARDLFRVFLALGLPPDSSVRGFCKLLACIGGGATHAREHAAAAIAWLDATPHELIAQSLTHHPRALRDGFRALTSEVGSDQRIAIDLFRIVRHAMDHAAQVGTHAPSAQVLAERAAANAQRTGDSRERLQTLKEPLSVTQKIIRDFSGHVFNFETPHSWYAADGLIVHNCRCIALAVVPEVEETAPPPTPTAAAASKPAPKPKPPAAPKMAKPKQPPVPVQGAQQQVAPVPGQRTLTLPMASPSLAERAQRAAERRTAPVPVPWGQAVEPESEAQLFANGQKPLATTARGAALTAAMLRDVQLLQARIAHKLDIPCDMPIQTVACLGKGHNPNKVLGGVGPGGHMELSPVHAKKPPKLLMSTMVHENIHTLGGASDFAYAGTARHIEEAVTEELTHAYMGWTESNMERGGTDNARKVTLAEAQAALTAAKVHPYAPLGEIKKLVKDAGTTYVPKEGAYEVERARIYRVISAVKGDGDLQRVRMKARQAGIAWKQAAYPSPDDAREAFIDALADTAEEREIYAILLHEDYGQLAD